MGRIVPVVILIGCLSATALAAYDAKQAEPWSLQDCIRAALENQVDVLTARNNVLVARSRFVRAASDYFPQLSLQNNAFTIGSTSGVLSRTSTGTALTVTQNIFDGGLREAGVLSARYLVKANQAGLTRTEQTVVFAVTSAYYELLRARHLAEVARKNVQYNEELRKQVEAMAGEGEAAKIDILPVEAQLAAARVNLLSAENAVRTADVRLQNAMGLAPQPGFDIREDKLSADYGIRPLDVYMQSALKNRPDVAQREASAGSARAELRSARLALYPRPVITGEYQHRVYGGLTSSSAQVIGGFVFDIFNGGANLAACREAQAARDNAELQLRQAERDIRAQVEEAYLNLTNAAERVSAAAVSLKAAEANYEAQKSRYGQGLGTPLDLLNAEVQLVTAQTNEVQARYDYYTAVAQMNYATGSSVPSFSDTAGVPNAAADARPDSLPRRQ